MADIIEEIGDLIGEEDKGDIRTATRTVSVSDHDTTSTVGVTIDDLVSVEQVVAILVDTGDGDYQPLYAAAGSEQIVGAQKDDVSENKVIIKYYGLDDTPGDGVVDLTSYGSNLAGSVEVSNIKIVARGY